MYIGEKEEGGKKDSEKTRKRMKRRKNTQTGEARG
jgi:hypothetical protein